MKKKENITYIYATTIKMGTKNAHIYPKCPSCGAIGAKGLKITKLGHLWCRKCRNQFELKRDKKYNIKCGKSMGD